MNGRAFLKSGCWIQHVSGYSLDVLNNIYFIFSINMVIHEQREGKWFSLLQLGTTGSVRASVKWDILARTRQAHVLSPWWNMHAVVFYVSLSRNVGVQRIVLVKRCTPTEMQTTNG